MVHHKLQALAALVDDLIAVQGSAGMLKMTYPRLRLGSNFWIFKAAKSSIEHGVYGVATRGSHG